MAEFPALPLFTDAYLGDTTHLTTQEHGAYLLLLMVSWRSPGCCVADDDALLARFTRMTVDKWRKVRPILLPFFQLRDGHWHQPRLQDEFRHLQSRREQQSKAGSASAKAKALKRTNRGSTTVGAPLQRNGNGKPTPTPTPSSVPKGTGAAAPLDPVKDLFDAGVELLTAKGRTEADARKIIGKWRKSRGEAQALAAIVACRDAPEDISEPVSWIEARFRAIAEPEDGADAIHRATAERYRRMDMPGPPKLNEGERR